MNWKICSLLKDDTFRLNALILCLMNLPNNIYALHLNALILRHHRKSEAQKTKSYPSPEKYITKWML